MGVLGSQQSAAIPRAELVAVLDRATAAKVTVISAPPGSGKTSLVRLWTTQVAAPRRVVSLSVRRGECDAQRLLTSLLREVDRAVGAAAESAEPTPTAEFDAPALVERILDAFKRSDTPVVLVIDDLHELQTTDAYAALEALVDGLPGHVNVVLVSRHDPQLRLHYLRLAGHVSELRAADLCFSEEETAQLLAASGIELAEESLRELHRRTEGWAAGLRLAAIALGNHPSPETFVSAFSGTDRTVSEYLLAEMLERQPESVRRLLLRSSIAEPINGPLADLLSDGVGAQEVLRALEDANAFVISLDPERTWFRFHHLFGDLLRLELHHSAPGEVKELHQRAATWFAEHDWPVEAVRHAQAAEDWPWAARLLADAALRLSLDGEESTIRSLLEAFPKSALDADPELALVSAIDELAGGSLAEAAGYLGLAERRAEAVAIERRPRFDVALAATRLMLARQRGDFSDVVDQVASLAETATSRSHADVALSGELRAVALMNLGVVEMWSLQLEEGHQHLEEAADIARRIKRPYLEVASRAHLGFAAVGRSFAEGRRRCREAIELADRYGWATNHVIAVALAAHGGQHAFSGEWDRAEELLSAAEAAVRREVEPATALLVYLSRGMLCAGLGDWAEAFAQFRAAEQMQGLLVTQHALAVQVRLFRITAQLRLGLLEDARNSLQELGEETAGWGETLTAIAAVHLADDRFKDAVDALAPVRSGAAPTLHEFTTSHAEMIAAQAFVGLGDRSASEAAVEQALELAKRDRLVLPFVMAGGTELLTRHPRHSTANAQFLLELTDILAGGRAPSSTPAASLDEPLSPGELRVLGFLPSNLSTPEIAGELFVTANTVKTHLRHIYGKLGARSRSQAVQRARDLGLLGPARR
jgi:LuxR family maltose regulon positive regulatory protein